MYNHQWEGHFTVRVPECIWSKQSSEGCRTSPCRFSPAFLRLICSHLHHTGDCRGLTCSLPTSQKWRDLLQTSGWRGDGVISGAEKNSEAQGRVTRSAHCFPSVHVAGTDAISGRGTMIQEEKLMNQRDESFIWTRLTFATHSTLDMCWI